MTINPSEPNFMLPVPDPKVINECPPGKHDWPEDWDYTHDPAGSMTCRKCRLTIHD